MKISWHLAVSDDIHGTADDNRHNTLRFQFSSSQTDALMTDRSYRNEQGNIHVIFDAGPGNGWCVFVDRCSMAVLRRDKVKAVSQ